ncbi:MAG TPA: class 1 fructose-bisphosphatase [Phycisphaerales bacterium]|nr:class 1 fructose-bisphosphatase [Phycisphaerales bacterium]HIB51389.1 class 1 fructose-bisphosphatase [Phycisphaerales bacterium]HIN83856.1 class 1 fructose-bisphosphatase [Phycisphaerales bacterium]HIO20056.1 class 1 fructose-bisphosphatase [Phycisphaerales bacterium]HIO52502.1 class 1 fructose-bisphosphatase [Phycisphaerales bacterium]
MDNSWTQDNLESLQSHILSEEQKHPGATGEFTWIVSAISLATKAIGNKVRCARIQDVIGDVGSINVQGESQQKLDIIANTIIMHCLGNRDNVGVLASEENETPVLLRSRAEGGRYAVLFDPLDGSSNLDVSVGVGTIFSVLRLEDGGSREEAILQPGFKQVAAGYVLYGSSTVLVLTTGNGVDMFVLDQAIGSFVLVSKKLKIPSGNKTYSTNEAYTEKYSEEIRNYLSWAHKNGYSSRYIGSMVADVHRVLLKGGVFLYPTTTDNPEGKLRLMYEANPMAMIIEQAGGKGVCCGERILDVVPSGLHQRTSVILGSTDQVDAILEHTK